MADSKTPKAPEQPDTAGVTAPVKAPSKAPKKAKASPKEDPRGRVVYRHGVKLFMKGGNG